MKEIQSELGFVKHAWLTGQVSFEPCVQWHPPHSTSILNPSSSSAASLRAMGDLSADETALVAAGAEVPEHGLQVTVVPCAVCGANCAYRGRMLTQLCAANLNKRKRFHAQSIKAGRDKVLADMEQTNNAPCTRNHSLYITSVLPRSCM